MSKKDEQDKLPKKLGERIRDILDKNLGFVLVFFAVSVIGLYQILVFPFLTSSLHVELKEYKAANEALSAKLESIKKEAPWANLLYIQSIKAAIGKRSFEASGVTRSDNTKRPVYLLVREPNTGGWAVFKDSENPSPDGTWTIEVAGLRDVVYEVCAAQPADETEETRLNDYANSDFDAKRKLNDKSLMGFKIRARSLSFGVSGSREVQYARASGDRTSAHHEQGRFPIPAWARAADIRIRRTSLGRPGQRSSPVPDFDNGEDWIWTEVEALRVRPTGPSLQHATWAVSDENGELVITNHSNNEWATTAEVTVIFK